jgi:hypothetical protein
MIHDKHLKLGKNASGDEIWICAHCGKQADPARSAQDKDHPMHLLMCPSETVPLGEWATLEEKNAELTAYKAKLAPR